MRLSTSLVCFAKISISLGLLCSTILSARSANVIEPGAVWLDNRFKPIQAHGGSIIRLRNTYFCFGEDRSQNLDPVKRFVACYSSTDLVNWTFRNRVLALSDPENLGTGWVLERPKVFYNAQTRKFIMYIHLDDSKYRFAHVGVAVSDRVDGNYTYVKSFRPLGQESRDIGQFVDDDGSAYLIFESRPTGGLFIAKLTENYMSVGKATSFIKEPLEAVNLVKYKSFYYLVGSHLSGWSPNPNVYTVARSLSGPWREMRNIAPPATNTYDSQSTMLLKIAGLRTTSVIYLGDRWTPKALWDSRYVWMPLKIDDGDLVLPEPKPWTIDVKSGTTRIVQ